MFHFTSVLDPALVSRPTEVQDNVIPASNSSMAKGLYTLGLMLDREDYTQVSEQMLANVYDAIPSYGSGFSNWGLLALRYHKPYYQIAITGKEAEDMKRALSSILFPIWW